MRRQSCTLSARVRQLILGSLILLLALPGVAAANNVVAEVENLGDTLVFYPAVEFKELILTVTGPCNYEYRQVVDEGTPFFRMTQETIDGYYTYSLVVIPEVNKDVLEVLKKARKIGNNSEVNQLCRDGKLPGDPATQSHGFLIDKNEIIFDLNKTDAKVAGGRIDQDYIGDDYFDSFEAAGVDIPLKDFVINDDLIVDGSACIGFDCVNGESFSFDTIRLKENNLRIKFDDTSVAASFPRTDWQLTANASANGGASKFSIDDISGNRTPFTVEANARSHSLYVDDGGRIGNRTSTPSTEIHTIDGDTPTLRLQQDGSSGFAPQTWDVAGNETNFFIRDVSNGSTLPFRIRPGAPTSSIFIDVDGDVGIGTASPDAPLHVLRSDGSAQLHVEETNGAAADRTLFEIENNGAALFNMTNSASGDTWAFRSANSMVLSLIGSGNTELTLDGAGNLTVHGNLVSGGAGMCNPGPCDGVFAPDFQVESIEEHAAAMWENSYLPGVGPTPENAPSVNLTKKTGGILNELEKAHIYIEQLNGSLKSKDSQIDDLSSRVERLEALLLKQPNG